MALLALENLTKSFGGVTAVQELSFTIEPGCVHAVIGPNGAGKTTLFNLITGVYAPTSGLITYNGIDVTRLPPHRRASLGMSRTFQNIQVQTAMPAIENVMIGSHPHLDGRLLPAMFRFPALIRGDRTCRERAEELMEFVGIGAYRRAYASSMPYGALKRLEIARALAAEPEMLLLDEPAAGLNARETAEIDELIQRIVAGGVTVMLVEHDMKLVMNVSDRILVLDYGRKFAEGTAEEVRYNADVIAAYLGPA